MSEENTEKQGMSVREKMKALDEIFGGKFRYLKEKTGEEMKIYGDLQTRHSAHVEFKDKTAFFKRIGCVEYTRLPYEIIEVYVDKIFSKFRPDMYRVSIETTLNPSIADEKYGHDCEKVRKNMEGIPKDYKMRVTRFGRMAFMTNKQKTLSADISWMFGDANLTVRHNYLTASFDRAVNDFFPEVLKMFNSITAGKRIGVDLIGKAVEAARAYDKEAVETGEENLKKEMIKNE